MGIFDDINTKLGSWAGKASKAVDFVGSAELGVPLALMEKKQRKEELLGIQKRQEGEQAFEEWMQNQRELGNPTPSNQPDWDPEMLAREQAEAEDPFLASGDLTSNSILGLIPGYEELIGAQTEKALEKRTQELLTEAREEEEKNPSIGPGPSGYEQLIRSLAELATPGGTEARRGAKMAAFVGGGKPIRNAVAREIKSWPKHTQLRRALARSARETPIALTNQIDPESVAQVARGRGISDEAAGAQLQAFTRDVPNASEMRMGILERSRPMEPKSGLAARALGRPPRKTGMGDMLQEQAQAVRAKKLEAKMLKGSPMAEVHINPMGPSVDVPSAMTHELTHRADKALPEQLRHQNQMIMTREPHPTVARRGYSPGEAGSETLAYGMQDRIHPGSVDPTGRGGDMPEASFEALNALTMPGLSEEDALRSLLATRMRMK